MNYISERIKNARTLLKNRNEGIIILSEPNRRYYSGFYSSAGIMLVLESECLLYLDFRYFESALIKQKEGIIPAEIEIIERTGKISELLLRTLEKLKIERLYFEDNRVTVSELKSYRAMTDGTVKFTPCGKKLDSQRSIKDELEIQNIKEAQKITDKAFDEVLQLLKRGMTEREVALEIDYRLRKYGGERSAFETIAVSGKKSSLPHGTPDSTVIDSGFLTMDFGAYFNGYCADMTRTVCFGEPTKKMKTVYETVLSAQNAAFSKIRSGVLGSEVDKAARDLIYNSGYEGCFGHSTGHSVGIEIHESPNFSMNESAIIQKNSVLSVEPGIYIGGEFGVRIEDLVVVTDVGYENITKSVKELVII